MGIYSVNLVGESHYQDAIQRTKPGDRVTLEHEPDNRFDRNAVRALNARGQKIGYIEAESWLQEVIAIDRRPVLARIKAITGGGLDKPSRGVVLEVLTGRDVKGGFPKVARRVAEPQARSTTQDQPRMRIQHSCALWALVALLVLVLAMSV